MAAKRTSIDLATAETIAALSLDFGMSSKSRKAYDRALANIDGVVGFHSLAINAARAFEEAAKQARVDWNVNADWILSTRNFASDILDFMIKNGFVPIGVKLYRMAEASIERI